MELSRRHVLQVSVLGGSALYLSSCTQGELTQAVNGIVVAANLTLGILESTGAVPAAIVMLVAPYLARVGQAVLDTNTEIQSADPAAAKAAKVANIWAMLANGVSLPADAPAIVGTLLADVTAAISALLKIVGAGQLQLRRLGTTQTVPLYQLTRGDHRELGRLNDQAMTIRARAMALAR